MKKWGKREERNKEFKNTQAIFIQNKKDKNKKNKKNFKKVLTYLKKYDNIYLTKEKRKENYIWNLVKKFYKLERIIIL